MNRFTFLFLIGILCIFVNNCAAVETLTGYSERAAFADDYGHMVHNVPSKVVRPTTDAEVIEVFSNAAITREQVTMRGKGHSAVGQSQCCGCIVMDMSAMNQVLDVTSDTITVQAGATIQVVLDELASIGRTTVAQTDWPGLSVGGMLSGSTGLGPGTFRESFIAESVLSMTVVTGQGHLLTASPSVEADLFHSVIGGLGQFGAITSVTFRTVPIPGSMIRVYHVYQPLDSLYTDYEKVWTDEDNNGGAPFDQLQSFPVLNVPGTGVSFGYAPDYFIPSLPFLSWVVIQEYGVFFNPDNGEPDNDALFDYFDAIPGSERFEDIPYEVWLRRLNPVFEFVLPTADFNYAWFNPHPWFEVYVPAEEAHNYIMNLFTATPPTDTPLFSVQAIYPLRQPQIRNNFYPLPDSPSGKMVYVGLLRQVDIASTGLVFGEAARLVEVNSGLRQDSTLLGGTPALWSTMPATSQEWSNVIDIPLYRQMKAHYDPQQLLNPGLSSSILNRQDPCSRNGRESLFRGTV